MIGPEREIVSGFLLVYAGLFPVVNPLGAAPMFLSLTSQATPAVRNRLAFSVAVNSFLLLLGSMLCGSYVLEFFDVTVPAVRVAGGALVALMGWNLLNGRSDTSHDPAPELNPSREASDGFYPLTLPLTVGPGSISVALTIGANQSPHRDSMTRLIAAIIGTALMTATIYLSYRFAERVARFLGQTAMNVIVRLTSFILLCIGVQIVWNGVRALFWSLH